MIHIDLQQGLLDQIIRKVFSEVRGDPNKFFFSETNPLRTRIARLYDKEILSEGRLYLELERAIIMQGISDYDGLTNLCNLSQFHKTTKELKNPEFLAYAIKMQIVREDQLCVIPLPMHLHINQFVQQYFNPELVKEWMDKIKNSNKSQ